MPRKKGVTTLKGNGKKKYDRILEILKESEINLDHVEQSEIERAAHEAGIENYNDLADEINEYIDANRLLSGDEVEVTDDGGSYPDHVKQYMKDISGFPLLTKEEEQELFATYFHVENEEEKKAARNRLFNSNTKLVIKIAKRYQGQGLDFLDLIQEGNIGLLKAIDKFDPERGYKFSTYAPWWIRQSITKALAEKGGVIREPYHAGFKRKKIEETKNKIMLETGHIASIQEVAEETGFSAKAIAKYWNKPKYESTDEPVGDDMELTLGDTLSDPEADEKRTLERITLEQRKALEKAILGMYGKRSQLLPGDITLLCLMKGEVHDIKLDDEMLIKQFSVSKEKWQELKTKSKIDFDILDRQKLNLREIVVISLVYGFVNGKLYTMEEVGELLKYTPERVYAIYSSALDKLRGNAYEVNDLWTAYQKSKDI